MTQLTRRHLIQAFGLTAGASALAACSVEGQGVEGKKSSEWTKYWAEAQRTQRLNFANWPLYLDKDGRANPSLDKFRKRSGIKVGYDEIKTSDDQLFQKLQPDLSSGKYCGYDLVTIANSIWFPKWKELGFLTPLDHERMPNFTEYAGVAFKDPAYDPGNEFQVPWQNGFTGIAYDPERTGREITSWEDLMDPAFEGKVGMMADISELPNSALLAVGVDPAESTEEDWRNAAEWLEKQKPLVRKYYGQDYIDGLSKGDIWISQAWSGDIFQENLSGSNLKFVMPDEGAMMWSDCLAITRYAKNPVAAMELIDFYYEPVNAAMVAEWVNYVTPVPEAKDVVLQDAGKASGDDADYLRSVAESYAVFPDSDALDKAFDYRTLDQAELQTWNSLFEPIYQS